LGVGFIYVPSVAILPQWFMRRRSLANGISAVGSGIFGPIFSSATGAVIENIGLEWSLCAISILTGIANTLAATFIRDRNAIVRPPQLAFNTKFSLQIRCVAELGVHQHAWLYSAAVLAA
jgi:MFS family permease